MTDLEIILNKVFEPITNISEIFEMEIVRNFRKFLEIFNGDCFYTEKFHFDSERICEDFLSFYDRKCSVFFIGQFMFFINDFLNYVKWFGGQCTESILAETNDSIESVMDHGPDPFKRSQKC